MACWKLHHLWMIFTFIGDFHLPHVITGGQLTIWHLTRAWTSDKIVTGRWELRINMWPSATKIVTNLTASDFTNPGLTLIPMNSENNNAPLVTGSCRQLSMEGLITLVVVDIHTRDSCDKREISSKLGILWYTVSPWSTGLSLYHVILCILFVVRSGSSTNLMVKSRVFSLRASQIVYLDPRLQLITRYPRHWNDYCTTCF